MALIVVSIAFC